MYSNEETYNLNIYEIIIESIYNKHENLNCVEKTVKLTSVALICKLYMLSEWPFGIYKYLSGDFEKCEGRYTTFSLSRSNISRSY